MSDSENVYPIYIASKGRALHSPTLTRLWHEGVPHTVFVEPQDYNDYAQSLPKAEYVTLPTSDRGLAYVRAFILNYAREQTDGWFWMLDDDIQAFNRFREGKSTKVECREALLGAQAMFDAWDSVGQGALEYSQYAWSAKKLGIWNSYCDVAVCIHVKRTKSIDFDTHFELKVDRDFTMQVLASGMQTLRHTRYAFSSNTNGSNAGGLHKTYQIEGLEAEESQRLASKWGPEICTVQRKKSGRIDAKINWRAFNTN